MIAHSCFNLMYTLLEKKWTFYFILLLVTPGHWPRPLVMWIHNCCITLHSLHEFEPNSVQENKDDFHVQDIQRRVQFFTCEIYGRTCFCVIVSNVEVKILRESIVIITWSNNWFRSWNFTEAQEVHCGVYIESMFPEHRDKCRCSQKVSWHLGGDI